MTLPGLTAHLSLEKPNFHSRNTSDVSGSDAGKANIVTPAWWDIGECDMGLCLIHCYEDEGKQQSICKVYELPF